MVTLVGTIRPNLEGTEALKVRELLTDILSTLSFGTGALYIYVIKR